MLPDDVDPTLNDNDFFIEEVDEIGVTRCLQNHFLLSQL